MIALIIFFGFILLSLIALLILNKIASKYLNGDYISDAKIKKEGDDIMDLVVGEVNEVFSDVQVKAEETKRAIQSFIHGNEENNQFVLEHNLSGSGESVSISSVELKSNLEMNKKSKKLICQMRIEDKNLVLNDETNPTEIRFHAKVKLGKRVYRGRTKWMPFSDAIPSLKCTLGPLKENITTEKLYLRLYGRKKKYLGIKCYGEVVLPLGKVVKSEGAFEIAQQLQPKAQYGLSSSDDEL